MTTQFANANYQEIIDLHTEDSKVSVLGIHTPCSGTPIAMLRPFFDAFQKFHYDGCSLSLVPAARLPADPLQVSYDSGESYIDPRDMLNPILWHGCHGNDMGAILNQFYAGTDNGSNLLDTKRSDSVDLNEFSNQTIGHAQMFESLYYRALTDNTWAKAHPQRGFRKNGLRPLVYDVATNMQFAPLSGSEGTALGPDSDEYGNGHDTLGLDGSGNLAGGKTFAPTTFQTSNPKLSAGVWTGSQSFFTPRLRGLGWLDTRQIVVSPDLTAQYSDALTGVQSNDAAVAQKFYAQLSEKSRYVMVPKLYMGIVLLPPAYKTEQYFRLIINHRFSFKKFRGASFRPSTQTVGTGNPVEYGWNDVRNYDDFNN